jgi:hypothetical protein
VRQATRIAELPGHAAEPYLSRQLQMQRDALLRKGVDPAIVEQEIGSLEAAIRHARCVAHRSERGGR